jgi:proline dehydrogenase
MGLLCPRAFQGGRMYPSLAARISPQPASIALSQPLIGRRIHVLKSFLLSLSKVEWARRMISRWPVARRTASRFVAGDTLKEAISAIQVLNAKGLYGTLDHLGEHVNSIEEAEAARDHYLSVFEALAQDGMQSTASLKLSQMGLNLDLEVCLENVERIMLEASKYDIFVRIDMEEAPTVDRTIQIYRILRQKGLSNVGLVVQAYLYRSEEDVKTLLSEGCTFRLCKGAYREPADIAHGRMRDINAAFDRLTVLLIDHALTHGAKPSAADGRLPPVTAVASHDADRIEFAKRYAQEVGLPKEALEFQMLHGIRSDLQLSLAQEGYPVRVYVPYGTEWYPYFFRRLAERPANLWLFISTFLRG